MCYDITTLLIQIYECTHTHTHIHTHTHTGHVEIIYDPEDLADDAEESDEEDEEDERRHRSLLIYTVTTFSVLIILTVVLLVLWVAVVRRRRSLGRHLPLLSEEQKISVLKQTGYVNPTYQFFDQTTKT